MAAFGSGVDRQSNATSTAAQMGRQLIHWEREGVMEIIRAPPFEAVDRLKALIAKKPDLVNANQPSRDNVGAALLHWCIIQMGVFQSPAAVSVVNYLLQAHWQEVVNLPYQQGGVHLGLFDGETALHLAVAFGDATLVELLLNSHANPHSRAYGAFFAPSGMTYFGEYPLSFAVTCGQREAAETLLMSGDAKKLLCNKDSFGNTALHLAAVHRRKGMFDWLMEKYKTTEGLGFAPDAPLSWQGANGMTPLGLAAVQAHRDDGEMFDFILERMSRTEWVFGRIKCTSVPLDQIDTIPLDPSAPQHVSLLALILCNKKVELSDHPHIIGVLEAKWEQFGKACMIASFALYLGRLVLLTLLSVEYKRVNTDMINSVGQGVAATESLGGVMPPLDNLTAAASPDGCDFVESGVIDTKLLMILEWTVFLDALFETIVVVIDFYATFREITVKARIIRENVYVSGGASPPPQLEDDDSRHVWDWLISQKNFMHHSPSNRLLHIIRYTPLSEGDVLGLLSHLMFVVHVIIYLSNSCPSHGATISLSISLITTWVASLKYAEFHRKVGLWTGVFFRVMFREMPSFLLVFTVLLVGFSSGLHTLSNQEEWLDTVDHLLRLALGHQGTGFAPRSLSDSMSGLAYAINLTFAAMSILVLLNLLVSVFTFDYSTSRRASARQWRLNRGRSLLLMERRVKLLFPFLTDSLRVNHFAGDIRPSHRFVYVAENADEPDSGDMDDENEVSFCTMLKSTIRKELKSTTN